MSDRNSIRTLLDRLASVQNELVIGWASQLLLACFDAHSSIIDGCFNSIDRVTVATISSGSNALTNVVMTYQNICTHPLCAVLDIEW